MAIDWSPIVGYDFFLSYKRGANESSPYASSLKQKLESAGLRCFLDDRDAPVGEQLNSVIERGIRRSRAMIVLCTEAALASKWVQKEVQSFAAKSRTNFIPVSFRSCLDRASRDGVNPSPLPEGLVWLNEDNIREPSDVVVGAILARVTYRRANTLRTWLLTAAVMIFAVIAAIATWQMFVARSERVEAERQRAEAERQTLVAERQTRIATARYVASEGLRAIHEREAAIGLVLLVESLRIERTAEAAGALFALVSQDPHLSMRRFAVPGEISALAFSPDGALIAVGLADGTVSIRDTRPGLRALDGGDFEFGKDLARLVGADATIEAVQFAGDSTVSALTASGTWLSWKLPEPEAAARRILAEGIEAEPEALALAGKGQVAAVSDLGVSPVLMHVTGAASTPLGREECSGAVISLDDSGRYLACGSANEQFRGAVLIPLRNDQPLRRFAIPWPAVPVATALSPDAETLVLGDDRGGASVWSIAASPRAPRVLEHEPDQYSRSNAGNEVTRLRVSRDNQFLVSRHRRTTYLWDLPSGELMGTWPGIGSTPAFSDDSSSLAFAMYKEVRLLSLRVDEWVDWACRNADRNLTREEWRRYVPDRPYHRTCIPE